MATVSYIESMKNSSSQTKITIYFDTRLARNDGSFSIKIRLYHQGKERLIPTGLACPADFWIFGNSKNEEFIRAMAKGEIRYASVQLHNSRRFNNDVRRCIDQAEEVADYVLSQPRPVSIDAFRDLIAQKFATPGVEMKNLGKRHTSLRDGFDAKIKEAELGGDWGNRKVYTDALVIWTDYLEAVHKTNNILLSEIDLTFLKGFEQYCKSDKRGNGQGMKPNSISVHLRCLRHIINRAIQDPKDVMNREYYPFTGYKLPANKTIKRAIDKEAVSKIRDVELQPNSQLWHHRNYWLFMFNNQGMNLIDLANLKRNQIEGNKLIYSRIKTRGKATFSISLTEESLEILNAYGYKKMKPEELVFPFIKDIYSTHGSEYVYATYRNRIGNHNKWLRELAKVAKVEDKLTSYVARHSWASIGFSMFESIDAIGQGLGHASDPKVTKVYAKDLTLNRMDEINHAITSR